MTATALAIDIGATKIEAGVVAEDGSIVSRCRVPTPKTDDAADVVSAIVNAVGEAVGTSSPMVCGVGVCGAVDGAGNVWTLNIPSFRDFALGDVLRNELSLHQCSRTTLVR